MVRLLYIILIMCPCLGLGSAECCFNSKGYSPLQAFDSSQSGDCEDGTKGTPCCGYGRCNWNCCECTTPCRQKGKTLDQALAEKRLNQSPHHQGQTSQLVLPQKENNWELRKALEQRLSDAFGGYTIREAWVYHVPTSGSRVQKDKLNEISKWLHDQQVNYAPVKSGNDTLV